MRRNTCACMQPPPPPPPPGDTQFCSSRIPPRIQNQAHGGRRTSLRIAGRELNSMALRQARTAAFCAHTQSRWWASSRAQAPHHCRRSRAMLAALRALEGGQPAAELLRAAKRTLLGVVRRAVRRPHDPSSAFKTLNRQDVWSSEFNPKTGWRLRLHQSW